MPSRGCFILVVAVACIWETSLAAPNMNCPTSGSSMHAGCQTQIQFKDACSVVRGEITKRVQGQPDNWVDPHNAGTYSFISQSDALFELSRVTGDKKYTDKINYVFEDAGTGCNVAACSQSQVFSIGDYGTNYCNIFDLYCSDSKCHPFTQLTYSETVGKCTEQSPSKCLP